MKTTGTRFIWVTIVLIAAGYRAAAQMPVKKVLLEEFTTASCGNCPPMSKYITAWQEAHAANCIVYTIHEGSGVDAMSNNTTKTIFNAMHPGWGWFAPAIMINRGVYPWVDTLPYMSCFKAWGSQPSPGNDTIALRLINEPAKVGIGISGTYNAISRTIDATVGAKFVEAVPSADWRIHLFLVEDSVVGYPGLGAFVGWDQHCYDAGWANTNYPGKFDGTSIIGYPHRHVLRKALLGDWGKQGIIPAVPSLGVSYQTTASLAVDTAYNPNHLSLVAFVSSYGTAKDQKTILNANDVVVSSSFSTGLSQEVSNGTKTSLNIEGIYPNPSQGETRITYRLDRNSHTEISVLNIFGQTVGVIHSGPNSAGLNDIVFDASRYAPGVYFVELKAAEGTRLKRFCAE